MATVNDVANYLLHLRNENLDNGLNFSLTNLKMQKLLYFCHAMFAVSHKGDRLIEDTDFQAWRYGPVIPEIYYRFNLYGQNEIPPDIEYGFDNLKNNEMEIINKVWETLRDKSAFDLVEISHATGSPWHNSYNEGTNNIINHNDIYKYFGGKS